MWHQIYTLFSCTNYQEVLSRELLEVHKIWPPRVLRKSVNRMIDGEIGLKIYYFIKFTHFSCSFAVHANIKQSKKSTEDWLKKFLRHRIVYQVKASRILGTIESGPCGCSATDRQCSLEGRGTRFRWSGTEFIIMVKFVGILQHLSILPVCSCSDISQLHTHPQFQRLL